MQDSLTCAMPRLSPHTKDIPSITNVKPKNGKLPNFFSKSLMDSSYQHQWREIPITICHPGILIRLQHRSSVAPRSMHHASLHSLSLDHSWPFIMPIVDTDSTSPMAVSFRSTTNLPCGEKYSHPLSCKYIPFLIADYNTGQSKWRKMKTPSVIWMYRSRIIFYKQLKHSCHCPVDNGLILAH